MDNEAWNAAIDQVVKILHDPARHAEHGEMSDQWLLTRVRELKKETKSPELEYGVIIGRASITGVIDPRRSTSEQQLLHPHGDKPVPWHFPAQYGLIVDGAKPLKRGIVARGYQGFWPVGEDTLKAIETVL